MDQYIVTGMSCAACQARVEKAVNNVDGVDSCSVSLLTNSMGVEGTASPETIINAVVAAGYGASLKGGSASTRVSDNASGASGDYSMYSSTEDSLKDQETPVLKRRLISSLLFLIVLMYFSMGHMMWGWPLPAFFDDNCVGIALVEMLLAVIVMVINQKFFVNGFRGLVNGSPNMDSLVALGSGASFIWSTYSLFMMTRAEADGDKAAAMDYLMNMYFESAAMILALITVGKMLEAMSKGKTTNALKGLLKLAPKTATVVRDNQEISIPLEQVVIGDEFVVKPGESIPVDGTVIEGESAVDESALTGESIGVDKLPGDMVKAGTINQSGFLRCHADRVGEDTTLSQIIQMVSDAAATKAPIARIADKVSAIFVPAVITVAVITFIVWMLVGAETGYALARAISVLVISCPCALGLATPVAIMVGNGIGAKNGILFKTSESLEQAGRTKIIALDKTGTITKGEPEVTDIIAAKNITDESLLALAYALEIKSEHPLAKAIVTCAENRGLTAGDTDSFKSVTGNGLEAELNGKKLFGGNYSFISDKKKINIPEDIRSEAEGLASKGKTCLYFAYDGTFVGIIAVADVVRENSKEAIAELKGMGIHVVMLTGDNEATANAIGAEAGVDEVVAGVLPEGKSSAIEKMKEYGSVAMVGDGINDAIALTKADTGIAIGAGTDVAIDAADVVVMKSNLLDVAAAIRLSRQTLKNIHENLFWAFIYNVIGIPLAAGCYVSLFGWSLNPMIGALAMSLSSFSVVSNALRLNLFKLYNSGKDKTVKEPVTVSIFGGRDSETESCNDSVACSSGSVDSDMYKENNISVEGGNDMSTVLMVEGMMCPHCEAAVNKAIGALEGVTEVKADHEANTVTITGGEGISEETYKKVIEDAGYEFKGMK